MSRMSQCSSYFFLSFDFYYLSKGFYVTSVTFGTQRTVKLQLSNSSTGVGINNVNLAMIPDKCRFFYFQNNTY